MAILLVRKGVQPGRVYPVFTSRKPTVVGREAGVEVCLDDVKSSRRNSRIARVYGHWCVEDLKSSNGTFLNAKRIQKAIIEDGASLQIGRTLLSFHAGELASFPDLELGGTRPLETLRENSGVFVFRGKQVALDREARVDWVNPARAQEAGLPERVEQALAEAAQVSDLSIIPLVQGHSDQEGIYVIFKGCPLPTLADELATVLAMPLDLRLQVFRQIVQGVLQRSTWATLRSPIGLAHVGLELRKEAAPAVSIPPLELAALVAEFSGDLVHLPRYVPYLPPEYQNKQRPEQPPFSGAMYNLGAIGYHLLTGRPPAGEGAIKTILSSHRTFKPAPADLVSPEIPGELSSLLARMLEKDPEKRPAGRQEVLQAIPFTANAGAAEGESPALNTPAEQAASATTAPATPAAQEAPPPPPRKRASRPPPAPARAPATNYAASLPVWTILWIALFFAARYLSKMLFQALDG